MHASKRSCFFVLAYALGLFARVKTYAWIAVDLLEWPPFEEERVWNDRRCSGVFSEEQLLLDCERAVEDILPCFADAGDLDTAERIHAKEDHLAQLGGVEHSIPSRGTRCNRDGSHRDWFWGFVDGLSVMVRRWLFDTEARKVFALLCGRRRMGPASAVEEYRKSRVVDM